MTKQNHPKLGVKPLIMYIRQITLFSFEEIIQFQQQTRLELILNQIDISKLANVIRPHPSRRGPKGYDPASLIYALIAMQVEKIQSIKGLVTKLNENPVLRYCCGFDVLAKAHLNLLFLDSLIN